MNRFLTAIPLLALSATLAVAAGHGAHGVKTSADGYFTDGHDMTLYTFDKDGEGVSNCYDKCATAWPPLLAEEGEELPQGFATIMRKDGGAQIAYKGQPLYLWINDKKPGQTTGDGVKGVWHIAKP